MSHATVKIGEYTLPLIGVPESATEQECSACHRAVHLSVCILDERGIPYCGECFATLKPKQQRRTVINERKEKDRERKGHHAANGVRWDADTGKQKRVH